MRTPRRAGVVVQCMVRAGTAAGAWYGGVSVAAGKTSLHKRGTHAGNTHKPGDNGKQSVYVRGAIVRITVLHLQYKQREAEPCPEREGAHISRCEKRNTTKKIKANHSLNITSEAVGKKFDKRHGATRRRTATQSCSDQTHRRRNRPGVSRKAPNIIPGLQGTTASEAQ